MGISVSAVGAGTQAATKNTSSLEQQIRELQEKISDVQNKIVETRNNSVKGDEVAEEKLDLLQQEYQAYVSQLSQKQTQLEKLQQTGEATVAAMLDAVELPEAPRFDTVKLSAEAANAGRE